MINKKNSFRTNLFGWRSFLGIAAVFFILLSSCGLKSSVKEIFGVQHTTKKEDYKKKSNSFLITESADCGLEQAVNDLFIQNPEVKLPSQAVVTVLLATVIPIIFGADLISLDPPHPLYGDTSRIHYSLPIFLQHERLNI